VYKIHQKASEKIGFDCPGMVVDTVKVQIPYEKIAVVRTPFLDRTLRMEYASGKDYSHVVEYYQLVSIDVDKFLAGLQACVNENASEIEEARVTWEPVYQELYTIASDIQSECSQGVDSVFGFYKRITKEEGCGKADERPPARVSLRVHPFSTNEDSVVSIITGSPECSSSSTTKE
jgi:hypothetical protein